MGATIGQMFSNVDPTAAAGAPAAPDMAEKLRHLRELNELFQAGGLTEAEFAQMKAQVLGGQS